MADRFELVDAEVGLVRDLPALPVVVVFKRVARCTATLLAVDVEFRFADTAFALRVEAGRRVVLAALFLADAEVFFAPVLPVALDAPVFRPAAFLAVAFAVPLALDFDVVRLPTRFTQYESSPDRHRGPTK